MHGKETKRNKRIQGKKMQDNTTLPAEPESSDVKKKKDHKKLKLALIIIALWAILSFLITLIFGKGESEPFTVSLFAPDMNIGGFTISSTIVCCWVVMAVFVIAAIIIRLTLVPKMKQVPSKAQNVIETMIEYVDNYTHDKAGNIGGVLPSYLFSLALLMIGCAFVELFGVRAPTADITFTFAMALITFFLINYYGIKAKGVGGRIKSLAQPTPVVFPMKIISDIAVPVSMACRLFGNMLGGMIVMELLYMALGNAAIIIPSVLGLYFNVFHPLIQAFIFITLTLTFIGEAVEQTEDK